MSGKTIAAVVAAAAAVTAIGTRHEHVVTADAARTPGVRNPAVTQRNIGETICVARWTATIRPPSKYTGDLELKQIEELGLRGTPDDYEEDHLISLALGGHPTSPRNLWPEPLARARKVDVIERRLHREVCAGTTRLRAAQLEIARIKHEHG
jgi:hypothetical protein